MAASIVVPLSEYLETTYHPDCDWLDGEIKERNVGEAPHSVLQKFFIMFFGIRERAWQIRVWPEQRVQVATTRFRIPDVCLTRRSAPFEEIIRTPPLVCIEILSQDDRMSDMQEKVDDYLNMGVDVVWVIDPRRRKIFQTECQSLQQVEALTVPETAIKVGAGEVFAELDELEGRG